MSNMSLKSTGMYFMYKSTIHVLVLQNLLFPLVVMSSLSLVKSSNFSRRWTCVLNGSEAMLRSSCSSTLSVTPIA